MFLLYAGRPVATLLAAISLVAISFVASWANAAEDHSELLKAIRPMIDAHEGEVALAIKHLGTGESCVFAAEKRMPSASLIKMPILVAAYDAAVAGKLSLDDRVTLKEDDKVAGSGLLTTHFSAGADLSLRDVCRLMIGWSDNTATNLVIDAIGKAHAKDGEDPVAAGINAVNAAMDRRGYDGIRLNSKVYRRDTTVSPERSELYGLGMMAPADTIALCEHLVNGDPFGAGADGPLARELMNHLRACQADNTIPRSLPKEVVVAHKSGAVGASRCDAGVIESPTGPIAIAVFTTKNKDTSWGDSNAGELLISQVAEAAFAYFTKGASAVKAPRVARVLRMGVADPLVAPLQRTLNRRLEPSPRLGVDGDFGPNTLGAVIRFQEENDLEPTGDVDSAFWKALGPLIFEDDPAPAPSQVAAEPEPRKPQDELTGAPVTTCKAWAIADGETGKLLFGYNNAVTRDPASTTKMMTAHLVCRLAAKNPAILDEVITFSEKADNTTGSTADVRAGELVTAGELLYGLMLPSGNDASVAFAEHFGDRFPGEEGQSSYDRFITAMNAEAQRLGMDKTGYRNPHGLTAEGHVTCAGDLVKLAHEAMQDDTFRRVVATRRHGSTLNSVDGYTRNVVWKNTDRLLAYEGFYGVKTGTTGPAGACLVSAGTREGKPLYVVVLGSTSGDARYVDARNLYRWAWKELGIE